MLNHNLLRAFCFLIKGLLKSTKTSQNLCFILFFYIHASFNELALKYFVIIVIETMFEDRT